VYYHDGSALTLSGYATVLDCLHYCGRAGSMEFIVVGDGRELWRSGPIFQKAAGAAFSINLAGVRELRLVVTDGGNGNAEDWGAWLNLEVGR